MLDICNGGTMDMICIEISVWTSRGRRHAKGPKIRQLTADLYRLLVIPPI